MKGSHEGVAHMHVRTCVRMHTRTFMCIYARTFTCIFRNKVTFKVTFYIKGNLFLYDPKPPKAYLVLEGNLISKVTLWV